MVDSAVDGMTATRTGDEAGSDPAERARTLIAFPYVPLQDVVRMVLKVEARGHRCRIDELAADLDQHKTSGAFRSRLSAGRMFGVTESVRGDVVLTELGLMICNSDTEQEAFARAFMNVPLYQKIYGKFSGGKLPPVTGIDAEMIRMGVPEKQASKARQVLMRSADMAGYLNSGRDRLVRPSPSVISVEQRVIPEPEKLTVPRAEVPMGEHELIRGLVAQLPPQGQRFTPKQRRRWLEAAKLNLELIYADDDEEDERPVAEPSLNGVSGSGLRPGLRDA
jgi:hypothetical protein